MLHDPNKLQEFAEEHEVDFSYAVPGLARFRVNAFRQLGSVSIVCRAIPFEISTVEELLLPPVINDLADEERGIILLTGTTGSGKSTTLAAMIDRINTSTRSTSSRSRTRSSSCTRDKQSIINQREVGEDTGSFRRALRRVLRQDPDVILVGEMRDEETVRTALSAPPRPATSCSRPSTPSTPPSRSTASSTSSPSPSSARRARCSPARSRASSPSASCRPPDGDGRVATCEVLRMTGRVRDMILNPDETGKLPEVIAEGAYYGMQTFDQALLTHVQAGRCHDGGRAAAPPHTRTTSSCSSPRTASARLRSIRSSPPRPRSRLPSVAALGADHQAELRLAAEQDVGAREHDRAAALAAEGGA